MITNDIKGQSCINVGGGQGDSYLADSDACMLTGSHDLEIEWYRTDSDQVIAFLVKVKRGGHDTQTFN